jgi:hypothetical protein
MSTGGGRFVRVPGWELVSVGLDDLASGRQTVAALLLASASQRLAAVGIELPGELQPDATMRLYELVVAEVGEDAAHSRYNALRRRLLSFLYTARRLQKE